MSYDESTRGALSKSQRRLKLFRFTMTGVMIVLLPPSFISGIAPITLVLIPVAFLVIPFMISAFFGEMHPTRLQPAHVRVWAFARDIEV